MFINRVKLYTNLDQVKKEVVEHKNSNQIQIECIGNKQSNICCFLSCSSPISDSKDYKILTKVFEKLMFKIDNVFVVNIMNCKSNNFIHYIHEFDFKKIIIFGPDARLNEIPCQLIVNQVSEFELYKILYTENLINITESKDLNLKKNCWESIQDFYKL